MKNKYLEYVFNDVQASRYALLKSLEEKDRIKHVESVELEKEYKEKIGKQEQPVIEKELEALMVQEKKEEIQKRINRKEKVDLNEIENKLKEKYQKMLDEVANQQKGSNGEWRELSVEDKEELEELYEQIVEDFHPEVHHLTDNQKYLYDKAMKYYRERKLDEMRIIYEMLYAEKKGDVSIEIELKIEIEFGENSMESIQGFIEEVSKDYLLAKVLYPAFLPTEEELLLLEEKKKYEHRIMEVVEEIEEIYSEFPFTAKETLHNEQLLQNYLEALKMRLYQANSTIEAVNKEIKMILEENGYETASK